MQNKTTDAPSQAQSSVRGWPHYKINERLRRAGLQHMDIAKRAGVSESQVSHTIRRRRRDSPACERVWVVLQSVLCG